MRYLTKKVVEQMWRQEVKPHAPKNDVSWLRESWNDLIDSLAKDGQISWHQADKWSQPKECA